jgi:hypothetical protein
MKTKLIWAGVIIAFAAFVAWLIVTPGKPGKLDTFASCIKESGAKFYGAFWCPHCQNQKALFGRSARLLPYIECSTPDGQSQLPVCRDAKVDGYPLWEFADGSRLSGEVPLETLSEKTSCALPQE